MTPLIDVVFLLLVFFLWSTSFIRPEERLAGTMAVPSAGRGQQSRVPPPEWDFEQLVIRIHNSSGQPSYRINDLDLTSLAALEHYLTQLAEISTTAPLIIHPDDDIPLDSVIAVYDLARQKGFTASFVTHK